MKETLIFIDGAFISKLSKHLGDGKYLKLDYHNFANNLAKKQELLCKHILYYNAPPFQSEPPREKEIKLKKGYDSFILSLGKNKDVTIRQGRCQKIINEGVDEFHQKGVDALMVSDMVSTPVKFPSIKKIILVTSDTDFCPIIDDIEKLGIKVLLYTYYEKKRKSKFSVSHHLIDCCENVNYLTKKDLEDAQMEIRE